MDILKHLARLAKAVRSGDRVRIIVEQAYVNQGLNKLVAETPKPYPQTPFNEHGKEEDQ